MKISLMILIFVFVTGAVRAVSLGDRIPELPATPYNYSNPALPPHFFLNPPPGGPPGNSSVISNDNTPADNPTTDAGATLGRVLFYDTNLSLNRTIACGSCHLQAHAFSDTAKLSAGFDGGSTRRHSMGLTNARFFDRERAFWDERAATLEDQALRPIQDSVEMGLTLTELVTRVSAFSYYPSLFQAAFGDASVTSGRIAKALGQFDRSLVSYQSKYDQARAQVADPNLPFPGFTPEENQGKQIFAGPGRCITCHITEAHINAN
ncbi:cytochrome-c peroxidase, partial [Candidatus Sumerlaeota bacterium]|nr:cytochrome-c peroxidase [Candidatus Sumerlaeota bacterium]